MMLIDGVAETAARIGGRLTGTPVRHIDRDADPDTVQRFMRELDEGNTILTVHHPGDAPTDPYLQQRGDGGRAAAYLDALSGRDAHCRWRVVEDGATTGDHLPDHEYRVDAAYGRGTPETTAYGDTVELGPAMVRVHGIAYDRDTIDAALEAALD